MSFTSEVSEFAAPSFFTFIDNAFILFSKYRIFGLHYHNYQTNKEHLFRHISQDANATQRSEWRLSFNKLNLPAENQILISLLLLQYCEQCTA